MFANFVLALDFLGTAVFAVTGALVTSRKQMDVIGFMLLAVVTGVGGGSVRDTMLGSLPVFWVEEPLYLGVCIVVAIGVFFLAHIPESRYRALLWLDAAGLAVFCVVGAEKAEAARRAFAEPASRKTPASLVRSTGGRTIAILDRVAAGELRA